MTIKEVTRNKNGTVTVTVETTRFEANIKATGKTLEEALSNARETINSWEENL